MRGDFSRLTFRPDRHYSAVLAQQGRVQLDADANEQAMILAAAARELAGDLIGRHAGPAGAAGFQIGYDGQAEPPDLGIGPGRYYVDGIGVDATRPVPATPVGGTPAPSDQDSPMWTYWTQPDGYLDPSAETDQLPEPPFLVYLRVQERLVTAVEDVAIADTALGAALPDTAARLRVAWAVRPLPAAALESAGSSPGQLREAFANWARARQQPAAWAAVRALQPDRTDEDPCIADPAARYRGPENQLYRIEVHAGGQAGTATFVWSRENGSVVFPIVAVEGTSVSLGSLGRDDKLDLHVGDWVEVVDDRYTSRDEPAALLQVADLDVAARQVRLSGEPGPTVGRIPARHPYLRRWDHRASGMRGAPRIVDGALQLKEGMWLDLEDGVQAWFAPGGNYRPGDYWVTPARTRDGDVEWPRDQAGEPLLQPPAGPSVHFAPLAWIPGTDLAATDLREVFSPLAQPIEAR